MSIKQIRLESNNTSSNYTLVLLKMDNIVKATNTTDVSEILEITELPKKEQEEGENYLKRFYLKNDLNNEKTAIVKSTFQPAWCP